MNFVLNRSPSLLKKRFLPPRTGSEGMQPTQSHRALRSEEPHGGLMCPQRKFFFNFGNIKGLPSHLVPDPATSVAGPAPSPSSNHTSLCIQMPSMCSDNPGTVRERRRWVNVFRKLLRCAVPGDFPCSPNCVSPTSCQIWELLSPSFLTYVSGSHNSKGLVGFL